MSDGKQHIVIIGAGLGGLICGYILSRSGYRTTIIEQHHSVGGCLQSFVRAGVKFDTGMHYIGGMEPGDPLHKFWDYMGLLDELKLQKLDDRGFDVIHIGGKEYRYSSGARGDNFVDALCEEFPAEGKNLKLYVERIKEIASKSIFYGGLRSDSYVLDNEYLNITINQFLDEITENEELKNVLIGNIFLFAGQKNITPVYLNALINTSNIEGAYRIMGGSDRLAASLRAGIEKFGGIVLTRSKVVELVVRNSTVKSAKLSDGRVIEGDSFISNAHPAQTLKMIEQSALRKSYYHRVAKTPNTLSVFVLYLTFKPNSVPYLNYNYHHHDNPDVWSSVECAGDDFGKSYLYMHQCDGEKQEFARSGIVMTFMNYDDVRRWEDVASRKSDPSYGEFTERCAQLLLSKLEARFAGIGGKIEAYHTSTPLTYCHYTGSPQGAIYGTALDAREVLAGTISHRTKLPNLYFVGQSTYAHGMLGVAVGSVVTCGEFLGLENIVNQINNE